MDYLRKYGITEEQMNKLENRYNKEIINFISNNEILVTDVIQYLYSENIKSIYLLMINNIQIFLETRVSLQRKVEGMKEQGMKPKEIQMKLLQER